MTKAMSLAEQRPKTPARRVAMVADLDRDILATSLIVECLFVLAKRRPERLLMLPLWLARGRAALKRKLAEEAAPDLDTLPCHADVLERLAAAKAAGTPLVLASSSDRRLADAIAGRLGLFEDVVASEGAEECTGASRRARLVARYGVDGFDDAALPAEDRAARKAARIDRVVALRAAMRGSPEWTAVDRVLDVAAPGLAPYVTALRPYQWAKNALVFVPLFAAHQVTSVGPFLHALLAFACFSFCASAGYVLNDLLDLPSDRRHPRKKHRPLASGQVSPGRMLLLVPALLAAAAALATTLPAPFLGVLTLYFALTLGYSLCIKDVAILDVLTVAGLYTLRVWAGGAAIGVAASPWLLAFSIFIFLSLAMVKRYAELMAMRTVDGAKAHARAYLLEDSELLAALGGASGYIAVLVLALYISGDTAHQLYARAALLWGECVLLLYWISYVWLMAHRARMHDDPLVFTVRDRVSAILVLLMGALFVLALAPDAVIPMLGR
jgi:4-hydroxybenzoate polyprenyltransferase